MWFQQRGGAAPPVRDCDERGKKHNVLQNNLSPSHYTVHKMRFPAPCIHVRVIAQLPTQLALRLVGSIND